jgi:hypothetical protein
MSIDHGQIDEIRPPSLMFASCPAYSNTLMVRENRCNGGLRGLPHVVPRAHDHVGAMCDIREEGVGSKRSGQVNGIWTWCEGGCEEEVCQGYRSVDNIFMTV